MVPMNVLLVIDVQGQPRVNVTRPDGQPAAPDDPAALALAGEKMAAWHSMLQAVSGLILDAVRRGELVVFLEDAKVTQPTHPALWHALGAHPAIVVRKYLFDGSAVLDNAFRQLGVNPHRITACGALTDVCVRQTVEGLRRLDFGVFVEPTACFPDPWRETDATKEVQAVPRQDGHAA